ncbi:hypothetical protein JW935_25615 [candidate division KSB1 bacterium]|nr:hypothetical protein [candidate division KSB1 bacterium]
MNRPLYITVFICYLFVCIVVPLCHTHEEDGKYHDNCTACQWELSHQNDSLKTTDTLGFSLLQWAPFFENLPQTLTTHFFHNYGTIRAPPQHTLF